MIGDLYPLLNLVSTQFILAPPGQTTIGLVKSTSVTTEQNNDVRWITAN